MDGGPDFRHPEVYDINEQENYLQMPRGFSYRWTDSLETYDLIYIEEESRVLGALQITIGIFHLFLGLLWNYIKITQGFEDKNWNYTTYILSAKYPLISALIHITSGTLAIITEKRRQHSLAKITVGMNIIGIIYSIYGMIILVLEFLSFNSKSPEHSWPEYSGKLLSNYLFMYTILYVFISWTVLKWNHKAIFSPQ